MLVDSHCHLDFEDFDADRADVLTRARAAGVGTMLTISTKFTEADKIIALAETSESLYCSIGIHPHEAEREPRIASSDLIAKAQHPKVVGIGETGLDYFYEHSERAAQKDNFAAHIDAACETGLPLIVHARDADTDIIEMLQSAYRHAPFPGLIHCFTAGEGLARAALDIGFYISISGIATFKSAADLRDVIATVPLERLLVETDSPYLAPMPHRGKRNEPAFVAHTAQCLAEIKSVSAAEIATATTENFFRLFTKAARPL